MFTIAQRDELREYVLRLAAADDRVVAGAIVGSLALNGGDEFSDLDLTFGVADHVPVDAVLAEWTEALSRNLHGVRLTDLEVGPTSYRVFLLPDALQLDLSMTPAAQFRPAGPRFCLMFGETAAGEPVIASPSAQSVFLSTPPIATDLFGWAVIYALHARACIERGRFLQAEHYVGAVRDYALSMACLRFGLTAVQARGFDDLPDDVLACYTRTHVAVTEVEPLRAALAASVTALLREAADAKLDNTEVVTTRLAELADAAFA